MLERLRAAWAELWEGDDTTSRYTLARHAAQARLAADVIPDPDPELVKRITEARRPGPRLCQESRIRAAGF